MKIAILWKFWNDYLGASLNELGRTPGVEILLCEIPQAHRMAPTSGLDASIERFELTRDDHSLEARLEQFGPDVVLVCGWDIRTYRRLARHWRGRAVRLLYMDNQWLGTARQFASLVISPLYLWPCFEGAFVTGRRQARFARKLGFGANRTQTGGIVADTHKFRGEPAERGFLFVGRLVPEKGIDVLAEAYRRYRTNRADPWPLVVCGEGPEAHRLVAVAGIHALGFVQPSRLPAVMREAACLVLPSRFEPFGVVVHEATSVGLQVITTDVVGAADLFVESFQNGRVVASGDSLAVTEAMNWVHDQSSGERHAATRRSRELASRQSPETWSRELLSLSGRFDLSRRFVLRAQVQDT